MIIRQGKANDEPKPMEVNEDPAAAAEAKEWMERSERNHAWWESNWSNLVPQAYGKFVAVAGEEGFIADTPREALEQARRHHPEDPTVTVRYCRAPGGPCIHACAR